MLHSTAQHRVVREKKNIFLLVSCCTTLLFSFHCRIEKPLKTKTPRIEFRRRKKMKYVLVTGGVVSGLGKGVTASSIGLLLKACGLRVTAIKIGIFLSNHAFFFFSFFFFFWRVNNNKSFLSNILQQFFFDLFCLLLSLLFLCLFNKTKPPLNSFYSKLSTFSSHPLKGCIHFLSHCFFLCHPDPYLNTDAGTMSPFEHGEVFVLDDGGEVHHFALIPLTPFWFQGQTCHQKRQTNK